MGKTDREAHRGLAALQRAEPGMGAQTGDHFLSRDLCRAPAISRFHPVPPLRAPPVRSVPQVPSQCAPITRSRSPQLLRLGCQRSTCHLSGLQASSSDPRATHPSREANPASPSPPTPIRVLPIRSCHPQPSSSGPTGPQLQSSSACHPYPSGPAGPPPPIHPCGLADPQLRSACHPSSPARSLFPGENPKPYCLGDKI